MKKSPNFSILTLLIVFIASVFLLSCAELNYQTQQRFYFEKGTSEGKQLYTAYNMWYLDPRRMNFVYKRNDILLPIGTKVEDVEVDIKVGDSSHHIYFTTVKEKKSFRVNFIENYHPGKNAVDYLYRTFSEKPFEKLASEMTETEIKAIQKGILVPGMSKQAVIASWGYPPEHRTGSLETNTWTYYIGPAQKKIICFGADDRTAKCGEGTL